MVLCKCCENPSGTHDTYIGANFFDALRCGCCNGSGQVEECSHCQGGGTIMGVISKVELRCPECQGKGHHGVPCGEKDDA